MGVNLTKQNRNNLYKQNKNGMFYPTEYAIETVFGCNAKCVMCFINNPTSRKKTVMKMDLFKFCIDEMVPYIDYIEKFDLWALGEPTIDPHLIERIRYARDKGYRKMAIASNLERLKPKLGKELLDTGIETIIFSIDAVNAETSEKIRYGLDFDKIMSNANALVDLRNSGNYKTRFIVRFIYQPGVNDHEWEPFKNYWQSKVDRLKGDDVYSYNEHNWGGYEFTTAKKYSPDKTFDSSTTIQKQLDYKKKLLNKNYSEEIERVPCHYVFESLIILADGTLSLCPPDFLEAQFITAKVPDQTPIEAFNSLAYKRMREIHLNESKNNIELCRKCTVLYSNVSRDWAWFESTNTLTEREDDKKYFKPRTN